MVNGLERLVYDGAKVADFAVQAADIVVGGLLAGHGLQHGVLGGTDRINVGRLSFWTTQGRWGGAAKLLGGIGVLRYGPATMVARTALNVTL